MKIIRLLKTLITPKIQGTQQAPRQAAAVAEAPVLIVPDDQDEDSYRRSAYN